MHHFLGDDAIGCLQSSCDVAFARCEFVSDVVAELFMNNGAAICRCFDISNRGQFFVIYGHQIHCIACGIFVSRHDCGDWMTDKKYLVRSEHAIIGDLQVRQRGGAGNRPHVGGIFGGVNRDDARSFYSCRGIKSEPRVRIQRTDKSDVQSIGQPNVINIMRQPFDQSRIFRPFYSLSHKLRHNSSRLYWNSLASSAFVLLTSNSPILTSCLCSSILYAEPAWPSGPSGSPSGPAGMRPLVLKRTIHPGSPGFEKLPSSLTFRLMG